MLQGWSCLLADTYGKVLVCRAELEAHGVPTWVPSETLQSLEGFAFGRNPLLRELYVPEFALERAREVLAGLAAAGRQLCADELDS